MTKQRLNAAQIGSVCPKGALQNCGEACADLRVIGIDV